MTHAQLDVDLQQPVQRSRRKRLYLYSAILLIAIVPSVVYGVRQWLTTGTAIVDAVKAANPPIVELPGVRFMAFGQGRVVPATHATASQRDVVLTGRAFFDVSPRALGPLRITTHAAVITSTSAKFTAWGGEGEPTMVGVIEGTVEVTGRDTQGNNAGEPLIVPAGKSVRIVRGERPTLLDP